ncbi:hypothetical protein [Amycolatopsis suaedae]|uniref:Uncharacterized protein n=1 Tax=Amycolatopsis suaedae TaxID=2510978 RepID=A0A4Q7J927_9PSEU|nr:hypothetical protein [Amycolatopsis suaedae]RZQ63719.1 hypothetical protein EWH70_11110 [Amycolatopsis suaedae]
MSNSRPVVPYLFAGLAVFGLVVAVIGTFLPWLRSGNVRRSSYETAGLADQFGLLDGTVGATLLGGWVALPVLGAACAGLFALRLLRTAAVFTVIFSLLVGTVAVAATVRGGAGNGIIGVVSTGPMTSTVGTILALAGAIGVACTARFARRGATAGAGVQP